MGCQYLWERVLEMVVSLLGWGVWRVYGENVGKILEHTISQTKSASPDFYGMPSHYYYNRSSLSCQHFWERISKIARSLLGWGVWIAYIKLSQIY